MRKEENLKRNVRKHLAAYKSIYICHSVENKWNNIKKIIKSQVEVVTGTQKKYARKPWMTDAIVELINERRRYKNQNSTHEQQQYK